MSRARVSATSRLGTLNLCLGVSGSFLHDSMDVFSLSCFASVCPVFARKRERQCDQYIFIDFSIQSREMHVRSFKLCRECIVQTINVSKNKSLPSFSSASMSVRFCPGPTTKLGASLARLCMLYSILSGDADDIRTPL